jgi:UDP-N-acetylglucosamine transferase subunit ALG13
LATKAKIIADFDVSREMQSSNRIHSVVGSILACFNLEKPKFVVPTG